MVKPKQKKNESSGDELLKTLDDFTSKENWDKFFSIRGGDDTFEWYAEWPNLKDPLLSYFSTQTPSSLQILVPGCGNSRLSENLYDSGFHSITNIDFSKVVISDMLRRNVRTRPIMRWRVMDMTQMQFTDEIFDIIVDKGGLDALMEPELGHKLGLQYISEVKRVLKTGGKFVCLTLAESHVLDLIFSKFRLGWRMSIHAIPHTASNKPSLQTFMVVAEKEKATVLHQITSSFHHASLDCDKNQARGLIQALEIENKTRSECSMGVDVLYSIEDLQLGAEGGLKKLIPGRRFQLTLGENGRSLFSYKAVLLDAQKQSDEFTYDCGVFIVPKTRAHEWLFSSEEGQWLVVESSKAARLIMVILDARHSHANMDDIQKDLSPLVKDLAPGNQEDGAQIPFMMAGDGVKQLDIVHEVTSPMTGHIFVEDVIYENVDSSFSGFLPSKDMKFRRLTFQRSSSLVQSEACLTIEGCLKDSLDKMETIEISMSKSKRKASRKRNSSIPSTDVPRNILKVNHQYLASSYHVGIIAGFMLVASNLQSAVSSGRTIRTVIVGLGAGLLPMFLRGCIPCLDIEVVELDSTVLNLAREYFGFIEDMQLKVYVDNGIEFIQKSAKVSTPSEVTRRCENGHSIPNESSSSSNGTGSSHLLGAQENASIDILIIDVDSSDSSSGMNCPHPDFVKDSFLSSVKESLTEGGLFVVNLVSRSAAIKEEVISRIKSVFSHLYSLQLEEDVNEVLFALPTDPSFHEDNFHDAALQLQKVINITHPKRIQNIMDAAKKIKPLS